MAAATDAELREIDWYVERAARHDAARSRVETLELASTVILQMLVEDLEAFDDAAGVRRARVARQQLLARRHLDDLAAARRRASDILREQVRPEGLAV